MGPDFLGEFSPVHANLRPTLLHTHQASSRCQALRDLSDER
jgi:hypothetical protein